MTQPEEEISLPVELDTSVPSVARVYDALAGGKDNFEVDRAVAAEWLKVNPLAPDLIRDARRFQARALRFMVNEAGLRQFIDIGSGLPTAENTHEVVQRAAPGVRVVYIDNDPIVLVHGRALLASDANTEVIGGDVREPEAILDAAVATGLIDLAQPVGVLLLAIVHHLLDEEDPEGIVARIRDRIAPGSHIAISHFFDAGPGSEAAELQAILQKSLGRGRFRTREEIGRFFTGLELVEPGLVHLPHWRPESPEDARMLPGAVAAIGIGGVGRKP